MKLVALLDPLASIPHQVSSILCLARAADDDVLVLVPASDGGRDQESRTPGDRIVAQVRNLADRSSGFQSVDEADGSDAAADSAGSGSAHTLRVERASSNEAILQRVNKSDVDLLLILLGETNAKDGRALEIGRSVLPRVTCRVAVLRLGNEPPGESLRVLVPAAGGPHSSTALRVAHALAKAGDGRLTALYVEPKIGGEAELVGRRVLERTVRQALGKDRDGVELRVVLDDSFDAGVAKVCTEGAHDLVVVGTWLGELGSRFHGTAGGRLLRRVDSMPVLTIRRAIPFTNRLRRRIELLLQDRVPQLDRDHRVELFERVQSNSSWNFDFTALILLSTFIAALGLLQNSAAVVIGAMLVAPLMTPILGVGLALVQGNNVLVFGALRTVAFGVVTAFATAALVGWLDPGHLEPSPEMKARGGPGVLDLLVAFVSGLAAAYATSRSNLAAALPGVAIAAALVPPIATSGLALSIGDWSLCTGALLLFFTNMVAIIVASSVCLSAVGVRSVKGGSPRTRTVGYTMSVLILALGVYFAMQPTDATTAAAATSAATTGREVSSACREAIAGTLPDDLRLLEIRLTGSEDNGEETVLDVVVGGEKPPDETLLPQLLDRAAAFVGDRFRVRLTHRWQAELPRARSEKPGTRLEREPQPEKR